MEKNKLTIKEQMERPTFQLTPAWSEDEYILASDLWKIFKKYPGTEGKKMVVDLLRNQNKWTSVQLGLPEIGETVLVWVRYKGNSYFEWTDSEIEASQDRSYVEPNSKKCWSMGSARGYEITHFMRIEPAFV